jgi:hypothetical protein
MAAEFFEVPRRAGIKRLLDVRSNNPSQLAGFTKRADLPFFLKEICATGRSTSRFSRPRGS